MTDLLLAVLLIVHHAAAVTPEDLFRQASASYESGNLAEAEAQFAQFRREYPSHQLYWFAGTMWAKCATDPEEAEKRLHEVLDAPNAPAEVKAECELELAHLALMQDSWDEAEKFYGAWLADHPADERGEAARFWRALSMRELGREDEAATALGELVMGGRQPSWRAMAGLLLGSLRFGQGNMAEARTVYREMAAAAWARDVRPQVLLGCANAAASASERSAAVKTLLKEYPESEEAASAKSMGGGKRKARTRWGVQVGAFSRAANAEAARKKWEKGGRHAAVTSRKMGHLVLQTVVVGPFDTREAAEREARALKTAGTSALVTTY
jgi:DedD protein